MVIWVCSSLGLLQIGIFEDVSFLLGQLMEVYVGRIKQILSIGPIVYFNFGTWYRESEQWGSVREWEVLWDRTKEGFLDEGPWRQHKRLVGGSGFWIRHTPAFQSYSCVEKDPWLMAGLGGGGLP